MTPDEHAAEALRVVDGDGFAAIVHALLALRPARVVEPGADPTGGAWVTYSYDGSSFAVHASELDARRAAAHFVGGDQVLFLPYGIDRGDHERAQDAARHAAGEVPS